MRFLLLAWYEFYKFIRDPKWMFGLIGFPILIIFLLGSAFESNWSLDRTTVINVALVNQDTGSIGEELQKFLSSDEIKKYVEITEYETLAEAKTAITENKQEVIVLTEPDLTENMLANKPAQISLSGNAALGFVETILDGFSTMTDTILVVMKETGTISEIPQNRSESDIVRIPVGEKAVIPGAMDYYSILTMLSILFLGSIIGVFLVVKQGLNDINQRYRTLPISSGLIFATRAVGASISLFFSAVCVMLFTKFVYRVNWNGDMLIILLTLFIFCFIAVSFGIFCGLVTKKLSSSFGLIFLLYMLFSAATGSFSPNAPITAINFLTPNYYAKQIIFGTIYGYPQNVILASFAVLVGISLLLTFSNALFSRRMNHESI